LYLNSLLAGAPRGALAIRADAVFFFVLIIIISADTVF
jgi:hypothetical protein